MSETRNRRPGALAAAAAALVLVAAAPAPAAAQFDYYARAGVVYTSTLLEDRITEPIEVSAGLGPVFMAGASAPIAPQASAGLEVSLGVTPLEAEEAGLTRELESVVTLTALANLSGRLTGPLGWRAGLGIIRYLPGEESGIFQDGGPTRLLVGGGVDYRRQAFSGWDLMVSARYDHHRFTTDALEGRGFTGGHGVHRVALTVGLAGGGR